MRKLAQALRGAFAFVLVSANTLFWCLVLFALALVKLALPFEPVRRRLDPLLNAVATAWIACNTGWMRLTQPTRWQVQGGEGLKPGGWYLVNANHQSWVDIFVLQRVLGRRIPLLKFFLKQELIYVPVIGLAWWALDFPFMRRHGKSALRANPALRRQDAETTRRACEKFALAPTSVTNFAEGTRFTAAKHRGQRSPYQHLLKPKAGALAFALGALGTRFRSLVDVTIVYPAGAPTFWDFLCGRVPQVRVHIRELAIPEVFCSGDYEGDPALRSSFHQWLDQLWQDKDRQIAQMRGEADTIWRKPGATSGPG
ncbi:acyltransferase [Ramlibacter tataouinensis]|uniref:acyltransferase n=1 Tax=Ramlibacter tataouinensis TaxID=94132 RepID=UPI0022F3820B|nr:acyltransferase [Ramlibacter tataouinensis]WBY03932.1 acyltransferase [Ramlibacter tataouinensis]